MNEIEILFLRTLDDINTRLSSTDFYEVMGISGLLRKLLLDGTPLIDRVNRIYHLKIKFDIVWLPPDPNIPGIPPPTIFFALDNLNPHRGSVGVRQSVVRDKFLSTVIMKYHNHEYTVRDVILFEANIAGGVHADEPKTVSEENMARLNSWVKSQEGRITLRQLKSIAAVVLKAAYPLRNKIEGRTGKSM